MDEARSFVAARPSAVDPLDALPVALLAVPFVPVLAGFLSAIANLLPARPAMRGWTVVELIGDDYHAGLTRLSP